MNGIDTNILVRLLAGDDATQVKQAALFFRKKCSPANPGWISIIVICELMWVLARGYKYPKSQLIAVLDHLLRAPFLKLEDESTVRSALVLWHNHNLDFSDALLAERNRQAGCTTTITFDHNAASAPGFTQLARRKSNN